MIGLPPSVRIFLCKEPTDMRRGFDSLSAMTRSLIQMDPLSGHLFVFRNRRRDRVKILYWDRSGFWILYKRLEKGTFCFPDGEQRVAEIEASELALMLEGINLAGSTRRPRFVPARQVRI